MTDVLISIQPKWCELIASGKKTVEVRKTRPKLDTPFKCYIYQTRKTWVYDIFSLIADWQGKVIGEFVCDEITGGFLITPWGDFIQRQSCLTYREIYAYGKNEPLFYWHISDLIIYDKPKELSEFHRECEKTECDDCPYLHFENTSNSYEGWCIYDERIPLSRPPQSWCYVESLVS